MGDLMQKFLGANSEENRKKYALEWKAAGGKVIGFYSSLVPVEVIYASGAMPWRLAGTWKAHTPLADIHRSIFASPYNNHVLQSLLEGDYQFLDAAVVADWDIDARRLWDVWNETPNVPPAHFLYVPRRVGDASYALFSKRIARMADFVATIVGNDKRAVGLPASIEMYNSVRTLVGDLYQGQKKQHPTLSGAELSAITTAAGVMPPAIFQGAVKELLGQLGPRKAPVGRVWPRVLLTSDFLDNPAYVELVEGAGGLVAMDDLDTGSRNFFGLVDSVAQDPVVALARRYLGICGGPRNINWEDQAKQVIGWVKEYDIQGVIDMPLTFTHARALRVPFMQDRLNRAGIVYTAVSRDYHLAQTEQLRTRLAAFMEMLAAA